MLTRQKNEKFKINDLKKKFINSRTLIKKQFLQDNKSIRNCKKNSNLIDQLIIDIFKIYFESDKLMIKTFCICAVGGYGRGLLAPFSDLDLLFIYKSKGNKDIENVIKSILYPLWDLGLKIGYAVRDQNEAINLAKKDHIIRTSMLDARLICGSKVIFLNVIDCFKNDIRNNGLKLLKEKIYERKKRIVEIGYDYFKNEPNLKESEGSLRDINLIFWVLKIFNVSLKREKNKLTDFLTIREKRLLNLSHEFLLLLRCQLHYQSNRSNDNFTFDYQQTIAKNIFKELKPKITKNTNFYVERMMKTYFLKIRNIKNLTDIFSQIIEKKLIEKNENNSFQIPTIKPNFLLENFLKKLCSNKIKAIDRRLIIEYIDELKEQDVLNLTNISFFKKILFSKNKERLLILFDLGIISKIIPEFSRISYLPQFDRFHSLTVGQHTLRALNILKDLINPEVDIKANSFVKNEYKKKFNKRSLFYATLLHDIGKGRGGNHNLVGAELAKKIVLKLNESERIANDTHWLVNNHSLLSDYAFSKDIEDFSILRKISQKIKKVSRLRSLYFLTITDISAVDQGIWSNWKSSLLRKLYLKIELHLNEPRKYISLNEKIENIKLRILASSNKISRPKLNEISKIAYPNYWLLQSEKMIIFQIENFFLSRKKKIDFIIKESDTNGLHDLILITRDRKKLFLNLISIFVSENLSIYEARIFTLDDGTVIDTFKFSMNNLKNFNQNDIERVLNSVKNKIIELKSGKIQRVLDEDRSKLKIINKKIDVRIDNDSSSTYSILIVKTNNRPKLLYDISNILIKNNIVISMAKISTNGDFVEDSFHLRSQYGLKIENRTLIDKISCEIEFKLKEKLSNAF